MSDTTAPFYETTSDGLASSGAVWLSTADGLRLRAGFWRAKSAKACLVLLPGRSEYLEKYADIGRRFAASGYDVVSLDWRGQGLSQRVHDDPLIGHVADFKDYQLDLAALEAWARPRFQAPWGMLAHSMGGLIGLERLQNGMNGTAEHAHPYLAVGFSAPMWGIKLPLWRKPTAAVLVASRKALPLDLHYAPNQGPESYVLSVAFEGNRLTSDQHSFEELRTTLEDFPALRLGGPSLGWMRTALRAAKAAMARPAPEVPALTLLGSDESIVLPRPIRRKMRAWPNGRLEIFQNARHEVLHESPVHRRRAIDLLDRHYRAHL